MEYKDAQQEMPESTEKLVKYQNILLMLPVLMIILAELLLFSGKMQYAIWMHVLVLIGLALATIYTSDTDLFKPYQALMLLPLLRLVNISMPTFFDMTLYLYIFIYVPLVIPVYIIAVHQGFTFEQMGFTLNYRKLVLPVSVIVGFAIAQGEYYLIHAGNLIPDLSLWNILKLSIVMIMFIGLIEELIFRSILQTRLEESMGMFSGLIVTSILFGVLHSGYGTYYEMLFVSLAGLIMGYMFQKTRSLPLIALTHGMVNIFLFGLIPLMGPTLGLL
jgi:hypothetical protein